MKTKFIFGLLLAASLCVSVNAQDSESTESVNDPFLNMPADSFPDRGGKAWITIETDPPGSEVYFDKELLGVTPIIKREVSTGFLPLYISEKAGCRTCKDIPLVNDTLKLWPGQHLVYKKKTLMPYGSVLIKIPKAPCTLYMDGEEKVVLNDAQTTLRNVPAGAHQFSALCRSGNLAPLPQTIIGDSTVVLDFTNRAGKKKK